MITGLDHIAIGVRDLEAAVDGYRRMLGVEPERQDGGGARRAWFRLPNVALELIAPDGEGPSGERLRAQLDTNGEGVWLLAFTVSDLDAAAKLAERRGLAVRERTQAAVFLDPASTAGLQLILLAQPSRPAPSEPAPDAVAGLDHVVVQTPNADRAVAIYGGRLGLDLRLDRSNAGWGVRQLFFKAGEAVVEFAASLKTPVADGPDSFGGLAWRVDAPEAVRARIGGEGFAVSDLRTGRKPGTHVFTVRDAPAGVPTLMLSAEPAPRPVQQETA